MTAVLCLAELHRCVLEDIGESRDFEEEGHIDFYFLAFSFYKWKSPLSFLVSKTKKAEIERAAEIMENIVLHKGAIKEKKTNEFDVSDLSHLTCRNAVLKC